MAGTQPINLIKCYLSVSISYNYVLRQSDISKYVHYLPEGTCGFDSFTNEYQHKTRTLGSC